MRLGYILWAKTLVPVNMPCGIAQPTGLFRAYVESEGYELNLTTTTPAIIYSLLKSKEWILARHGREKSGMNGYQRYGKQMSHLKNTVSCNRVTYSFWHKVEKPN